MSTTLFVIPCGAAKLDQAAPARRLYTSPHFAHTLTAALAEAEATERDLGARSRVVILSAKHGLVGLDTLLAPYEMTIAHPDRVSAAQVAQQLLEHDASTVVSMLPKAYARVLLAAIECNSLDGREAELVDAYEGAAGIGYQRGIASSIIRGSAMALDEAIA